MLVVISDKKLHQCDTVQDTFMTYRAEVLAAQDYYPFGMLMPDRIYEADTTYRYGFNGKEQDRETYGQGNVYDYGFRIYNPRLGRFLSMDPLSYHFPYYTPYQYAANTPIAAIDLEGLEDYVIVARTFTNSRGETHIYRIDYIFIRPNNRATNSNPNDILRLRDNTKFDLANQNVNTFNKSVLTEEYEKSPKSKNIQNKNDNDENDYLYNTITSFRANNQNAERGSVLVTLGISISFEPNQGRTINQVETSFSSLSDDLKSQFDNIVGTLINDPNAVVDVTGYASNTPTDIEDTETEVTVANNEKLALQRADAGRSFLIKYAKEKYGIDIDESRVIAKSGGVGDSEVKRADQRTHFGVRTKKE